MLPAYSTQLTSILKMGVYVYAYMIPSIYIILTVFKNSLASVKSVRVFPLASVRPEF